MKFASKINDDGIYVVEMSAPWFTPDYTPKAGNVIGFNATFDNDIDEDGVRDSWIAWVEWTDKPYWAAVKWLGSVTLVDAPAPAVQAEETAAVDVTPAETASPVEDIAASAPQAFDFMTAPALIAVLSAGIYTAIRKKR